MPTIFKRPRSPYHVIRYLDRNGRLREQSSRVTDRRRAEAIGTEIEDRERAIREGRISPAELEASVAATRPIEEHVEAHLAADRRRRLHARHLAVKAMDLRRFFEGERIERIGQIEPKAIRRHLERLVEEEGLSARTANRVRATILRFLAWAVEDRRLAAHPCPGRAIAKRNEEIDRRRCRRSFTESELERLFAATAGTDRGDAYKLAFFTGLRRSELAKLRWSDVHLDADGPYLRLRAEATKAKKTAEIPLASPAVEILERLAEIRVDPTVPVLRSMPTVHRLYRDLADAGIQAVEGRRAVPDASGEILDFHALRRSLATILAARGASPLHVKRLMRHASIETTDRHYVGLRLFDLGRELDRLGPLGLPTKVPTSPALDRARSCSTMRATGSGDDNASRSEAALVARLGDDLRDVASKRAKGLEPSTFSLEDCALRVDSSGNRAVRRGTANESANVGARQAAVERLLGLLAELPNESIEALVAVASSMRPATPARRSSARA